MNKQPTRFIEMLFLLFLGLKLAGCIDWSWWWVFSPIMLDFVLQIAERMKE